MSRLIYRKMSDRSKNRSLISGAVNCEMSDPPETLEKTRCNGETGQIITRAVGNALSDPSPVKTPEFVTPSKAVESTGLSVATVKRYCESGKYEGAYKVLKDGVEVWQIPISSLPKPAQMAMLEEVKAASIARCAAMGISLPDENARKFSSAEYSAIWEDYERSGGTNKRRANAAFEARVTFQNLIEGGLNVGEAEREIARRFGVSKATLWRYRKATEGHLQMHWLPLLSPRYKGGRPLAEFSEAAFEYIHARTLTTSGTPYTVIFQEARDLAEKNGWVIPGDDAIRKRLAKEPKWVDTMGRKGPKALERSYPAVRRDYSSLKLHELWESDGRKADVFCVWPDGTVARPFIIVWRDVRSRLVLGVRGFLNPSAAGVLAAYGMALSRAGTAPDNAKLDNGREYAAKSVTGGQANRYRFKVVPGEPVGLLTMAGTNADWSPPERGQDKPVESWWRFLADRCDKAPEFEGAYCGRNTVVKPENFDRKKAIPIAVYAEKLAGAIQYFNTRHRHSGSGMSGRTPLEVYTELSALTERKPVDPAHIRMCKMGVASIKPGKSDSVYTLTMPGYGLCRYWSKKISGMPLDIHSRKHSVYYDLENPRAPVSIYDGHNWLDDATLLEDLPFLNAGEGAADHVKAKNGVLSAQKLAVKQ
ncbi:MAG: hypothetical protein RIR18_1170, partial [Pseudomonadota bacterium]